jgi:hypothetical protein
LHGSTSHAFRSADFHGAPRDSVEKIFRRNKRAFNRTTGKFYGSKRDSAVAIYSRGCFKN